MSVFQYPPKHSKIGLRTDLIVLSSDDNLHTKAHLLSLSSEGIYPGRIYVLTRKTWKSQVKRFLPILIRQLRSIRRHGIFSHVNLQFCRRLFGVDLVQMSLFGLARQLGIPCTLIEGSSVNDPEVIRVLSSDPAVYVISNAPGILRAETLSCGKSWINCHKGILPEYRGSSASYWAILEGGSFGATVHLVDEGIDTGPIILRKEFSVPVVENSSQMKLYEAFMVSSTLAEALRGWVCGTTVRTTPQARTSRAPFFAMHPALAQAALNRVARKKIPKTKPNTASAIGSIEIMISKDCEGTFVQAEEAWMRLWKSLDRDTESVVCSTVSCLEVTSFDNDRVRCRLMENARQADLVRKSESLVNLGWMSKLKNHKEITLDKSSTLELILLQLVFFLIFATQSEVRTLNSALKVGDLLTLRHQTESLVSTELRALEALAFLQLQFLSEIQA